MQLWFMSHQSQPYMVHLNVPFRTGLRQKEACESQTVSETHMRSECPDAMQQPERTCVSNVVIHHADKPAAYRTTYKGFLPISIFSSPNSVTQCISPPVLLVIQGTTLFTTKLFYHISIMNRQQGLSHFKGHSKFSFLLPKFG